MTMQVGHVEDVHGARIMGLFGDSITTDHISPAGNIKKDSPAGRFLQERGVQPADFNSYGSRRGNDDVMVRGTFANIRIKNLMFGGEEGGNTLYYGKDGAAPEKLAIYDAAVKYKADGVPLVVLAGKEYGTGSSRDWAAKGTNLLGVKAVIAESFERIHRSNLVGMGCCRCSSWRTKTPRPWAWMVRRCWTSPACRTAPAVVPRWMRRSPTAASSSSRSRCCC